MALTSVNKEIAVLPNGGYLESGYFTWSTTNTTGGLATALKIVIGASFTPVSTGTPSDEVTLAATPDAKGRFIISGGTLSLSRTSNTSGLGFIYTLRGQ